MPGTCREQKPRPMPSTRRRTGTSPRATGLLLGLAVVAALSACAPEVIEVGPTREVKSPSRAIAEASDGDTVLIDPGVYADCALVRSSNVTIQGAGPGVVLTSKTCGGKAILVTRGSDITIRNLTLQRAAVRDHNGAGIRSEGVNLTVDNVRFLDNEEGILAGDKPGSTIRVINSDFEGNGTCAGSGCAHGIYVNHLKELDVGNSRFFDQKVGHHVKSRAYTTQVIGNHIEDGPDGTASYEIDVPDGGSVLIEGNTIEKGPKAQNWGTAIAIGEEGHILPSKGLIIRNNKFTNDTGHETVFVRNEAPYPAQLSGNVLSGKVIPLQGPGSVQ
jgi:Right handed beta helix region